MINMMVLCLCGALLNIGICRLAGFFSFPLYMDTILTITITLCYGFFWGALCGILGNTIFQTIWFWGWEGHLFTLCSISTAFITYLFMKLFPRELNLTGARHKIPDVMPISRHHIVMDHIIVLILLSFALCLVMSILGGLIAGMIITFSSPKPEDAVISSIFGATMFNQSFPVILTEILSRIPVNIPDRLISVFAAFGIALPLKTANYKLSFPMFTSPDG